jgi:hypothetical protein
MEFSKTFYVSDPIPVSPTLTSNRMKSLSSRFLFLALVFTFAGAPRNISARTMRDIPGVSLAGLRTYMPQEAYDRLITAPIKAWIVIRGQIVGNKISGARVVHSEGNHVYDKVCLRMSDEMQVYTDVTASRLAPAVVVNVFIFQLPNGNEDALGYAQDDSLGASNFIYSRSLVMRTIGVPKQTSGTKPKK